MNVSETGRAIRKDSLEGIYGVEFLKDLVIKYYVNELLSSTDASEILRTQHNIPITSDKFLKLCKKLGVSRTKSEAVSMSRRAMSYDGIMTDEIQNIIDGMLMGDGSIVINENTNVGRFSLGSVHEEFAQYCSSFLKMYGASVPVFSPGAKGKGMWNTRTYSHPDFYTQYQRWYPNGVKIIPHDIVFTKIFMIMWYLGDGCLSGGSERDNSRYLYFSTNSFSRESLESIVVPKFKEIGIEVRRICPDNCVYIATNSFWPLLQYMGGESPVKCFQYKFDLDDWRKLCSMHDACKVLDISYQKLSNWVKIGAIEHTRSPGGKKVFFTDKELSLLKTRIDSGELPRESGKRARKELSGYGLSSSISALGQIAGGMKASDFVVNILNNKSGSDLRSSLIGKEMIPVDSESDDVFLNRVVDLYQKSGFPYPIVDEDRKLKLWQGLQKTMSPELLDTIKWRTHGNILATSYHKHIYELGGGSKKSPMEVYNDKDLFKEAIKKYKELGGRLTYGGVLQALCSFGGARRVNNYSPLIVRDVINCYSFNGARVIDPCAGFGGRLIGCSVSRNNCSYTGIDPSSKTISGLHDTQKFLFQVNPKFSSNIIHGCAEDVLETFRDGVFDLCFTCPPYFDTEKYSIEESQSSNRYETYDLWINDFIGTVLNEVFRVLKSGSKAIFHVGNVKSQNFKDDFVSLAVDRCKFSLYKIHPVMFPAMAYVNSSTFEESMVVLSK